MLHAGALAPGGLKRKVSWLPTHTWIGCGDAVFVVAITNGCAFVVPRKFPLEPSHAEVMLLPVSNQASVAVEPPGMPDSVTVLPLTLRFPVMLPLPPTLRFPPSQALPHCSVLEPRS
jgi:hypothetical protein